MTPADFQSRYGIDAKSLRRYLRSRWPHPRNDPWYLDDAMLRDACDHFGVRCGTAATAGRSADSMSNPPRPVASSTPTRRSSGLHVEFAAVARRAGIPLSLGRPVPWLSGRGHLAPTVADAPTHVLAALRAIHAELGGDAEVLARKALGNPPTPDLVHDELGILIEVDEVQHFTTARLLSLNRYPADVPLGFDIAEYRSLIRRWLPSGDRAFAHKVAADFPGPGGRQSQRAYNDALRDLLAPTFTGQPLIRLGVPDRSMSGAVDRLRAALARLA